MSFVPIITADGSGILTADGSVLGHDVADSCGFGVFAYGESQYGDGAFSFSLSYSLSVDPGSYAVTGSAADLRALRLLAAAAGSYLLTGDVATFFAEIPFNAAAGAYAINGSAVTFSAFYAFLAAAGSYGISGSVASLMFFGLGGKQRITLVFQENRMASVENENRTTDVPFECRLATVEQEYI